MRINYNISSILAKNALSNNDNRLSNSIQRLSSGLKINSAKDNAAGLAISRKMDAQIKSLQQANQNSNDGVSVANTVDGAMAEMHDIMQRMNELAVQSANGTNSDMDRSQIQKEIDQLVQEIDRIANTTEFNAQNLLDGSFALKGYTNTENIKVMSYAEGVTSGTYAIAQLQYNYYEDEITYTNPEKEVKTQTRYEVSSDDDVKAALVNSASLSAYEAADAGSTKGYKAFPDGAKVTVEDENIVIKAENDFEIKLALNNRGYVDTGINTTTVSSRTKTECYRNITLTSNSVTRYNIREINVVTNADTGAMQKVYSKSDYFTDLKEDFADFLATEYPDCDTEIKGVNVDVENGIFEIEVEATSKKDGTVTKGTHTFKLHQEKNESGEVVEEKTMESYLYSTTMTTKTEYTIGGQKNGNDRGVDDCIALNITGMGAMVIQVGANEGQIIRMEIPCVDALHLGLDNLDISTEETATKAIDKVANAINQLSGIRSKIGAYANRLERAITNLDTTEENMTAAYSRIIDVDVATEMTEYTTVQVLVQSSTAMLAQANERPQQVLQLLQ